ncbi:hypothetical protein PRIPAC_86244 [Pristionchus pacificus]|uniref:Uncharacterized protein n=1 Tax=Pristionchus pacificus TaxID=54126 RepID=A0A2A6CCB3_PRIPA|nr:hypothetical protein PRIPAC_86244 [Pristionchus pacificus]|eukprot:PDM75728.1 hypothetical protein PRIPAC_40107 [Pristionchus pacificus]
MRIFLLFALFLVVVVTARVSNHPSFIQLPKSKSVVTGKPSKETARTIEHFQQAGRNEVRAQKDNKSKFLRDGCSSLPKGCSCIEGKDDNGNDIVRVYEGSKCFQYKANGFAKIQTEAEDAIEF